MNSRLGIAERLLADGLITHQGNEQTKHRIEHMQENELDALVASGAIDEKKLLTFLASLYRMHFVSTVKLAQANVPASTLRLLSKQVAKKFGVFPIMFDATKETLSVVIANPTDPHISKQLMMATSVHKVITYLARPASVRAAISKHYDRDQHAFARIVQTSPATRPSLTEDTPANDVGYGFAGTMFSAEDLSKQQEDKPKDNAVAASFASVLPPSSDAPSRDEMVAIPKASRIPRSRRPSMAPPGSWRAQGIQVASHDYLETLNLLIALSDHQREGLRGHSAQVAQLCSKLCDRLRIADEDIFSFQVASHIHDVGKASSYHLTALNVARFEGHASQAKKTYLAPVRLFESVRLPKATSSTLEHLYERYDGQGFPDRVGGKEIPLGSRILAVVETFSDLTSNPRNPYKRTLSPQEALDAIAKESGTIFDSQLTDLFRLVIQGDGLRAKILRNKTRVLIVEPNIEETTTLQLRLMEHGYAVELARDAQEAKGIADQNEIGVIISEIELPPPIDGLKLQGDLKKSSNTADVPLIFLTGRADRETVNRAFEGGAKDYLVKPTSADVVVAKALQALQSEVASADNASTPQGIRGSLAEMALPDLVQVLSQGRKNGRLSIRSSKGSGEVYFSAGQVFHATSGEVEGSAAFYKLVTLMEGDFDFDPSVDAPTRTIEASPESLLLEGMRLLDEAGN